MLTTVVSSEHVHAAVAADRKRAVVNTFHLMRYNPNEPCISLFTITFSQEIPTGNFMITYEILSKTKDGKLVSVVSSEAKTKKEAIRQTANFCYMMDIEVHSVRAVK